MKHLSLPRALVLAGLPLLSACAPHYTPLAYCRGDCVNGNGSLSYPRNGQVEAGPFSQGIATGTHTITLADGRTLTAPMLNGVAHGQVRIRTTSGHEYEQTWAYGVPVRGKTIHANGDVYEGSYRTVLTNTWPVTVISEGTYLTTAGVRYEGRFQRLDNRLVFSGTLAAPGKKPVSTLASAPMGPATAPLGLTPLKTEELAVLKARHSAWSPLAGTQPAADPLAEKTFFDLTALYQHYRQQHTAGTTMAAPTSALATSTAGSAALAPATAASSTQAARGMPTGFNLIEDNSGKYMSPFTSDGVAAGWVDKAVNAQLGSSLGAAAGAYAGQKALEQVPFVGGFLGSKVGKSAGRSIALNAVGGEAYLRESSDISFNDVNEMARWLVATHAQHTKFQEIMKAAYQIYPELQQAVLKAQVARR